MTVSCCVEIYNITVFNSAKLTNLLTRLLVICPEDIGLANPKLVMSILKELNKFYKIGRTIKHQYDYENYRNVELDSLIYIVKLMCYSKKTRYGSWIFSSWLPDMIEVDEQDAAIETIMDEDYDFIYIKPGKIKKKEFKMIQNWFNLYLYNFDGCLGARQHIAVYWITNLLNLIKEHNI